MSLAGLSVAEIMAYYNARLESQLRLSYQFADGNSVAGGILIPNDQNCKIAHQAIKAYIRSGFPVLLLVDANRMMGRGHRKLPAFMNIYYHNGYMQDRPTSTQLAAPCDLMHMIMVFAYSRDGYDVVFNDPGLAPFLWADLRNLFGAGCYLRPAERDRFAFGDVLQPPLFLTISPRKVRMPLLSAYEDTQLNQPLDGLYGISREVGWPTRSFRPRGSEEDGRNSEAGFLLLRAVDIASKTAELCIEAPALTELVNDMPRELAHLPEQQWIWIETRGSSVLVWDAEADPETWDRTGAARRFLIAYGAICADGSRRWDRNDWQPPIVVEDLRGTSPDAGQTPRSLSPALITSYARDGLVKARHRWCDEGIAADIY